MFDDMQKKDWIEFLATSVIVAVFSISAILTLEGYTSPEIEQVELSLHSRD